ncbi:ATP-grasp fold amidoligase family protein, partial [Campylobacter molothri]|uniref:ATP-grasp fold amidoligase family protein n=3 Tax=Campylobacter molothri TaxID=1032242 RepID=UPI00301DF796
KLTQLDSLYNILLSNDNQLVFDSKIVNQIGIYQLDFLRINQIKLNESLGASYQDNGLWFQIFSFAKRIYFINEAFYILRRDNPNSSVYSKDKVYAICEEYDFIRDMFKNKRIPSRFLPLVAFFRYRNYLFTLERISKKHKLNFLYRFAQDFDKIIKNGELTSFFFNKSDFQKINLIIKNPEQYYLSLYGATDRILLGSAERIRSQLSYKIGKAIVSKKINQILKIPYIIIKHRIDQKIYQAFVNFFPHLKLPSLEEYQDYEEAIKVKSHLSYQLGNALIKNPITFVFKIKAIYLNYKNRTKKSSKNKLSDEEFLLRRHEDIFGYTPDFKNPKTFNEKLVYRILYDRTHLYSFLADKLKMRIYVSQVLENENNTFEILSKNSILFKKIDDLQDEIFKTNVCKYLPKLYGIYKNLYDIDYSTLPESFVLKTNHDCGGYVIVKNKKEFLRDIDLFAQSMEKLKKHLNWNYYDIFREWHYKDIEPRIFAEELLLDEHCKPADTYKFHIFDKKNKNNNFIQVTTDRFDNYQRAIYNYNWDIAPFNFMYETKNIRKISKPLLFDSMFDISLKLSKPFDYVRIDLYQFEQKIYVGELTFTHGAAGEKLVPNEWDNKLGDLWKLKRLSDVAK